MSAEANKPSTYIEVLKDNLIRAYQVQSGGFERSIEVPVFSETLSSKNTETFLKLIGNLMGRDDLGLDINREVRDLSIDKSKPLEALIIILTPKVDMDIDTVFEIIKEYEGS